MFGISVDITSPLKIRREIESHGQHCSYLFSYEICLYNNIINFYICPHSFLYIFIFVSLANNDVPNKINKSLSSQIFELATQLAKLSQIGLVRSLQISEASIAMSSLAIQPWFGTCLTNH